MKRKNIFQILNLIIYPYVTTYHGEKTDIHPIILHEIDKNYTHFCKQKNVIKIRKQHFLNIGYM